MDRRTGRPQKKKVMSRGMQGRFALFFWLIVAVFLFLIGRMLYLHFTKNTQYSNAVLAHQSYVSSTIPYKRGTITDRNGTELAYSTKIYNVILDPAVVLSSDSFVEPTLKALSEAFDLDYDGLMETLTENAESSYVQLIKEVEYDRVEKFNELQEENHKVVKGVWFETEYRRTYPYDSLACHVIGYTNSGNVGTYGIEQIYNDYLNGRDGRSTGYYDNELNLVEKTYDAEDGDTVVSTIDVKVQSIVEEKMAEFRDQYSVKNIGVVIMNPKNGEILAMASNNGYNLNDPRDLTYDYTQEEIDGMTAEEKMEALNKMWRNFCVCDAYEPGSTFKVLTVAAALEENLADENDQYYCGGYRNIDSWTIHCNKKTGHGYVDLTKALMFSCNCALIDIAEAEGRSLFRYYQTHFGLGSKTGVDLPGEASGQLVDEATLNVTELATSSFGQGFTVNMLQILSAYCSVVNGGYYYRPHVVSKVVNSEGATVYEADNTLVHYTVSEDTSEFIKEAMYETVEAGTASPAQVSGYSIGGKTGTAQKLPRSEGKYVVSFVGGAPADDPEVCIYVVIDEIDDEEVYNTSKPATSLSSKIMSEVLPYLEIYPDDGEIDYGVIDTSAWDVTDETNDSLIDETGTTGGDASEEASEDEEDGGENNADEENNDADGDGASDGGNDADDDEDN